MDKSLNIIVDELYKTGKLYALICKFKIVDNTLDNEYLHEELEQELSIQLLMAKDDVRKTIIKYYAEYDANEKNNKLDYYILGMIKNMVYLKRDYFQNNFVAKENNKIRLPDDMDGISTYDAFDYDISDSINYNYLSESNTLLKKLDKKKQQLQFILSNFKEVESDYTDYYTNEDYSDKSIKILRIINEELSEKDRVIMISYIDLMSLNQVAKMFGCSRSYIQKIIERITKQIKQKLLY